jgi:histidyl-tRNA synthetase
MKFQSVKGMDDLFSCEVEKWQQLEARSRDFFEAHGFREIRTPIVESMELFARSIGEASDIVHKEMYAFQDRGGRNLALRPEMTAAVVRSALEHSLIKSNEPLFVYYMGPMFRAERPQAGRRRQFHQIGVETLNTVSAQNDAELIILVKNYLDYFGLKDYTIKLNHLGSADDRARFQQALFKYFEGVQSNLCEDCRYRLTKNVLRIFDCKVESCQFHIQGAPKPVLSPDARTNLEEICSLLKEANVDFELTSRLVRGLDYYTGSVFEVTAKGLGAQDAVLAGGRYDSLIQDLGGPKTGASGFSIGVERFLLALEAGGVSLIDSVLKNTVYVAGLVQAKESCAFYRQIASALLEAGKRAHFSFSKSGLGAHLKHANQMRAGYALIVGEDEWKVNEVSLKNMASGVQARFKIDALAEGFKNF